MAVEKKKKTFLFMVKPGACFLKVPQSFCCQKAMANSKSNDYRAVLFAYSYMNRHSLYKTGFRHMQLSVFSYRILKNSFVGLYSFWGYEESGPR